MELSTLRRSTTEARVAGVCVALADRWRVDPLLVRLMAVLLALSGGLGLVLYAAAWVAVPRQGSDRAAIDQFLPGARRAPRMVWLLGLAAAAVLTAILVGGLLPFGIGPAIVVGVVCYLGLQRSGRLDRQPDQSELAAERTPIPPPPFSEQTRFTEAAYAWQVRVNQHLARAGRPPAGPQPPPVRDDRTNQVPGRAYPPPAWPHPAQPIRPLVPQQHDPGYSLEAFLAHPDPVGLYGPDDHPVEEVTAPVVTAVPPEVARRNRRRARLRSLALILLPVIGVAVSDIWLAPPGHAYLAAALLGVGVALLVGTWHPRPRGLVAVGVVLALATLGTAASSHELGGTPTVISYRSATELPASGTRSDVGPVTVEMSELRLDSDTEHTVSVDAGQLRVYIPADVSVRVNWSVDAGSVELPNQEQHHGVDLQGSSLVQQGPPGSPTLTLNTHVDVGELKVRG